MLLSKNPPTLGEDALLAVSQDFRIIVPEENAEAYKTAEGWKDVAGSVHGLTYQLEVTPPNGSLEIFRGGGTSTGSNPTSVTFTVTNKSAVPLSGLKVSLDNAENFTLDIALMDASLAPGESTTFTVSPKAELAQGSYQTNITVTSDIPDVVAQYIPDQVAPAEATMVCTVKTVGLTATPASLDFGSAYTGYTQPEAKTVTVTNTGEQAVTLTQPASRYYDVITAGSLELPVGGETTFNPDGATSRAMLAAILWRLEGSPVVNYAMDFADVEEGQWYTEAIRWAASEGIVTGYGDGAFGTNDSITREQFAVMLYRYAGAQPASGTLSTFRDGTAVSDWAAEAMGWAVEAGLITGTGDGSTLTPQGQATRAQAAVLLMRWQEALS